jgi:hypothetical protein
MAQNPVPGTPAARDAAVTVDFHQASDDIAVPSLVGLNVYAACGTVQAAGFQCGNWGGAAPDVRAPGEVFLQEPVAGAPANPGSVVTVAWESRGPVPLHVIRGQACDGRLMRVWYATVDTNLMAQLLGPNTDCGGGSTIPKYVTEGQTLSGHVYTQAMPGTQRVNHCEYPYEGGGSRHNQHAFTLGGLGAPWTCEPTNMFVYTTPVPGSVPLYAMRETTPPGGDVASDGRGTILATGGRMPDLRDRYGFVVYETWYVR